MTLGARLGILGGTLDPVHLGHVETALAARAALGLDRVLLLPSRVPPHRSQPPLASTFHRFAMTALAVNGIDGLEASDAELSAPGTSYTADTLERFHTSSGLRASQIFFILGADAFAEIETWSRYPHVLDLASFVVVTRPGTDVHRLTERMPALRPRCADGPLDAEAGGEPRIFLVPAATPDVSSTGIRRRLRAGEPVTGLVPEPVERHIRQHGLYVDAPSSASIHLAADHLHGQN